MSPTRRIQLLHIGVLLGFIALVCETLWWRAAPVWVDLVGVGGLYVGLWLEAQWVRHLFAVYGDRVSPRSHQAARSMLMTRLLIAALSVVLIAAALGRL